MKRPVCVRIIQLTIFQIEATFREGPSNLALGHLSFLLLLHCFLLSELSHRKFIRPKRRLYCNQLHWRDSLSKSRRKSHRRLSRNKSFFVSTSVHLSYKENHAIRANSQFYVIISRFYSRFWISQSQRNQTRHVCRILPHNQPHTGIKVPSFIHLSQEQQKQQKGGYIELLITRRLQGVFN